MIFPKEVKICDGKEIILIQTATEFLLYELLQETMKLRNIHAMLMNILRELQPKEPPEKT